MKHNTILLMCCIFWNYIYHYHFKESALHVMFDLNFGLRKHVLISKITVIMVRLMLKIVHPGWKQIASSRKSLGIVLLDVLCAIGLFYKQKQLLAFRCCGGSLGGILFWLTLVSFFISKNMPMYFPCCDGGLFCLVHPRGPWVCWNVD